MLRMAAAEGTTDIVASPHASPEFQFHADVTAQRVDELQAAMGDAIRIHKGCDFHLSFDNITDAIANPRKYSINSKGYLLVEFSDFGIFQNTATIFERIIGAGMLPIITHPERNRLLQMKIEDLAAWAKMGCLIQVTAASFLGRFGSSSQKFSEELMSRGLVHVIASDAHDIEHRPPTLKPAREHLARKYGEDVAERLTVTTPRAVIDGQPVWKVEPGQPGKKWYRFW